MASEIGSVEGSAQLADGVENLNSSNRQSCFCGYIRKAYFQNPNRCLHGWFVAGVCKYVGCVQIQDFAYGIRICLTIMPPEDICQFGFRDKKHNLQSLSVSHSEKKEKGCQTVSR